MTITLRVANKQDLNEIVTIYNDANLLFDEHVRSSATESTFYDLLANDVLLIATVDHKAVAFISYHTQEDILFISGLYVMRNYQKKGIGTLLISTVLKSLTDVEYVLLKVLKLANWAISFYQKYGFTPLNQLDIELRSSLSNRIKKSNHSETLVLKCSCI